MKPNEPIDPKDLAEELTGARPIALSIDAPTLFHLIAALQLALRHPEFPPRVKSVVAEFIQQSKRAMGPISQKVIEQGADPAYDEARPAPISDEEFTGMLNGPLSHPLLPFKLTRLIIALSSVVAMTGPAGAEALRHHCQERQQQDERGDEE